MYALTYIDRSNVSTAAFVFKQDLHLSNTQVGLVFSAFAYPYLLFQIVGGWLSDRFISPLVFGFVIDKTGNWEASVSRKYRDAARGRNTVFLDEAGRSTGWGGIALRRTRCGGLKPGVGRAMFVKYFLAKRG